MVDFYRPGGGVFARDEAVFRRIRDAAARPLTLLAVDRGGERGFDDPVWDREGRYAFVKRVREAKGGPDRSVPYGLPLEFDFADRRPSWDRLFGLTGLSYHVELYDLDGAIPDE